MSIKTYIQSACAILVAVCFAAPAWATDPGTSGTASRVSRNLQFSNITAEAGLSAEFVQAVVQDAQGYLWFGTQDGLNRYDGHDMVSYDHDPKNPRSLSNSFVWALHLDADGQLWVGTDRGVSKYDYATDSFERHPFGLPNSLKHFRIREITQDKAGVFWLGTVDQGLVAVDTEHDKIRHYTHDASRPDSLPHDHVIAIHEDRKGRLWIGTDGGGLARLDHATDTFVTYRHDDHNPSSLSDDAIRSIYEDRAGTIWIGTSTGGVNSFDDTTGSFRAYRHDPANPHSLSAGQVPSILEDERGTLWVGTENGLSEWRPASQGFVHYRNQGDNTTSLANDRINAMFQDSTGVLWLATNGGVSSWNYFSDPFTHYQTDQGFLNTDVVTSIAETRDGVLWIGTYGGGLSKMDSTGRVTHFRHDPNEPGSLSDDRVMVVHIDHSDRIWVGTRSGGVNLLDPTESMFRRYRQQADDPRSLSSDAITSIQSEPDGTLWVGAFGAGLNRSQSPEDGHFEHFVNDPDDPNSLSNDRVLTIHADRSGQLWIGTEGGGLNKLNREIDSFTTYSIIDGTDDTEQMLGTPWEIVETADGTFWIGTMGQGLLRWDAQDRNRDNASFHRYGQSEGVASNIYGIAEGTNGDIWLSSNRGLFHLDPEDNTVRRFDRRNGLRGTEFNLGARLRSRSGRLLFGGNTGIVAFYPGELPQNLRPPKISVVAHSRDKRLVRASSVDGAQAIEIGYLDPFVAFDFVALDFVSPDKNQYRYRLRGFDMDWTEDSKFRRATYTNLPSGDYVFEVQASNNDGVWNRTGATIDVSVIPPPWQRWWAYLSYGLIIVGFAGWYLRHQQRKLWLEVELRADLERQVKERTAELARRYAELQSLNERLAEASVTDSLTGLRNRRYVDQFINTEISMVERRMMEGDNDQRGGDQRDSSKLMFFMMIDLDGFKAVNDTYGHHAGDEVLVQVKDVLMGCCRKSDVVVRWGGDEFMIIGHASNYAGVKILAERIRESVVEQRFAVDGQNVGDLSASIGVTPYPFCEGRTDFGTWEQVSGISDQAAYIAKENGRDAWVSVRGTALMTPEDLNLVGKDMQTLVDQRKLVIDSSLGTVPELRGSQAGRRLTANG